MPRQLEHRSDQELSSLVKDVFDWDSQGTLPDGILRIEASRLQEKYPTMDTVSARKIVREESLREAAARWMETQGFQV